MHDASAALQKAIVARLRANVALVSNRVYDRGQKSYAFPYILLGAMQSVPDDAGCIDGATCFITLHIWSRDVGGMEGRRVSDQVAVALKNWSPDLSADGFAFVDGQLNSAQTMLDPDGLTTHGVLTFEAQTERAA